MQILHVIASFNPVIGGPAEVIRNITLEHDKLTIKSEVVCLDEPNALFLTNLSPAFTVHALGHADKFWFFNRRLITWLKQNVARFDTIIIHGLWLYPSFAVNAVIQRLKAESLQSAGTVRKVPQLLVFPHGMLDPYFQGGGRRLKAIRNWIYWKLIERRVVSGADALLFTCETELLLARKTFSPYQPKQEINVGNGIVDPPPFSTTMTDAFLEKCPGVTGRPYLLFLSRINYKKGVDLLVSAYAAIVEAQLEAKQQLPLLVIAGPGLDTAYGEMIRQLIQKHPVVDDMIFFPGMLTGNAKWGAIYGCEAFSLPSHQENFGIVVAEALACGKPVLISNQVNIWREVVQGGSGIIGDDSPEGTQQVIELWLSMAGHEQQKMAHNARKTFENHFQMERVIHRLNNVFDSINSY
jgi:glycosyltransferase involved in cell wall biosynthesis